MVEETIDSNAVETTEEVEPEETTESPSPVEEQREEEIEHLMDAVEQLEEEKPEEESLEGRLKVLEAELEQSKAESQKNHTNYLRVLADMDNLRKRTAREKENARKYALESFSMDLLDVMDNVTRALDTLNAGVEAGEDDSAVQSVIQGVQLIQTAFEKTFEKNGIVRIDSLKQPFDPNFHQAVQQIAAEEVKPGTVVQEMRAGYTLNERLLRPSMVAVSQ